MVPTPWLSEIVALTAPLRLTKKVSLASGMASPATVTERLRVVMPGAKVRVPDVAV